MDKPQTIEEFYQTKMDWMPEGLKKEIGHFNVFDLEELCNLPIKPQTYSRKDFFKISLIRGNGSFEYADRDIAVGPRTLFFGNPLVPYNWKALEEHPTGAFCIFTEAFFDHFG